MLKAGSFVKKDNRGVNERESVITGNLNSTFGAMVALFVQVIWSSSQSLRPKSHFSTAVTCPFVPVHFQSNA